ncbi:hypothetical protein [Actinomyces wuliandei]|uniref:hypothetical protein n=1 Tax=Actinomyces wuliandei TaxID=2057743 RepID=UPI000FD88FAB|nr:hypothetical protein [Actinomyces wuliandei]
MPEHEGEQAVAAQSVSAGARAIAGRLDVFLVGPGATTGEGLVTYCVAVTGVVVAGMRPGVAGVRM